MAATSALDDGFKISTTWVLESENKELRNCLTINTSTKSVELDEIVRLETCVHLLQGNKEPCTINISLPEVSSNLIARIVIVSEARIVELFGSCGEYLSTCTAEYIDDFEDCAVYMAESWVKPSKQLLIKFQKAKHSDSLWLYGINLTVSSHQSSLPSISSINFQAVNEILKDTKIPISENAEKCKAFLQTYISSQNQGQHIFKSKPPNPQLLMKMFESQYINPISGNVSKCFSNFVPFISKESSESNSTPEADMNKSELSSEIQFIKNYIDMRFRDLENKIHQDLRELESRQNQKLDCIIDLLSKQNNQPL